MTAKTTSAWTRGEGTREEAEALIARLQEMAMRATTDVEMRRVTAQISRLTREYRIRFGIGFPPGPLEQAGEINPGTVSRPHLEYLSRRIARAVRDVERGQNRQLAISMPPRHGKSELLSVNTPVWILRRHPEWNIISSSHESGLTTMWAKDVRNKIAENPSLGIMLERDGGKVDEWSTAEGGGLLARSVRAGITGRGARVMIIDDPIRDFVEAHSIAMRNNLWNWWLSVAQTRLEPPYLVLVIACMTGDTPVLRPDGTETPLRDIRPGDLVASYDKGRVVASRVLNWANQGPDAVFAIKMKSGRTVRANARHPFLVLENGAETWQRTDQLRPGSRIRLVTGGSGAGSPVRAESLQSAPGSKARDCACPATTSSDGPREREHPRSTRPRFARLISSTGTESPQPSMTRYSRPREESAPCASSLQAAAGRSLITSGSASIMTTRPGLSGDFSAIAATSLSDTPRPSSCIVQPSSTYSVSSDEVIEITSVGVEDVFDIEVETTHNFIANGLATHNTRWHEDDMIGRLFSDEWEGDPKSWERISVPAIAEEDDVLGRQPGDPLYSPVIREDREAAIARWEQTKVNVGSYTFSAMYQQRPAPAKGAVFDSGWWRFWTMDENRATEDGRVVYLDPSSLTAGNWCDSWDFSFKSIDTGTGGWVVGQRWVRFGANRYLVAQQRGRWTFTMSIAAMGRWAITDDPGISPCGHLVHTRLVEERANGAAIINVLRETISGIKPINPTVSKVARARAVTPEIESGNVYLPHPSDPGNEWVHDYLSELRNFPNDAADDQVDTTTQALAYLHGVANGQITNPAHRSLNTPMPNSRNIALVTLDDVTRRRDTPSRRSVVMPTIRRLPPVR